MKSNPALKPDPAATVPNSNLGVPELKDEPGDLEAGVVPRECVRIVCGPNFLVESGFLTCSVSDTLLTARESQLSCARGSAYAGHSGGVVVVWRSFDVFCTDVLAARCSAVDEASHGMLPPTDEPEFLEADSFLAAPQLGVQ